MPKEPVGFEARSRDRGEHRRFYRLAHQGVQALILYAFWLLLSGHYDWFHLGLGVLSVILVVRLTHDLMHTLVYDPQSGEHRRSLMLVPWHRLLGYLPWLLVNIAKSNLQVAYLVLHPRMPIAPVLIRFKSRLSSQLARVTLANSITLTPGTITVDLKNDEYLVHALIQASADLLIMGVMQKKVAALYREEEDPQPRVLIGHVLDEEIR